MRPGQRLCLPFLLLGLLQACATPAPPLQKPEAAEAGEVELTLNLPQPEDCACTPEPTLDYTFLERGLNALSASDYIEAVQQFQRYKRLENTAAAGWEADLAIAYISMLPRSPFYDPDAAVKSHDELSKAYGEDMRVHGTIMLMREALESFAAMTRHVEDLEGSNTILREDLEKREQALRRLRELTLGQKAATQ